MDQKARRTAVSLLSTALLVMKKRAAPMQPARMGVTAQATKTWVTPCQPQLTSSMPMLAAAVPMSPPTMAWVVETGIP